MNDAVRVEMRQSVENLLADVRNPVFPQRAALHRLDKVVDRPGTTELHHQPQLVVLAVRALLNERAVVRRDVAMVRVLPYPTQNTPRFVAVLKHFYFQSFIPSDIVLSSLHFSLAY